MRIIFSLWLFLGSRARIELATLAVVVGIRPERVGLALIGSSSLSMTLKSGLVKFAFF